VTLKVSYITETSGGKLLDIAVNWIFVI